MKNTEVADILYEIADFLEIQDVEFKPRAYRRAARNIESLTEDIETVYERGELEEIEGVGGSIADKIAEYLETGDLEYHRELKQDLPIDIDSITRVEGVGPKSARKLYDALGITTIDELRAAAEAGKIADVSGFGETSQQNILDHIEFALRGEERLLLGRVFPLVDDVEARLSSHDAFDRVIVVGSFRRRTPTVGDIDILATASDAEAAMAVFTGDPDVVEVLSSGSTRSSVRMSSDLQVDLRVVDDASVGAALQYFTGSKDHNITTRNLAIERGWKLNEYGLFDEDESVIASETEESIYDALGLQWIPPELREDTGEVTAAANGELPELVELGDIKGDLQSHSTWSDGSNSVLELAQAADDLQYEYLLISDHGPSLHIANGISQEDFAAQRDDVRQANDQVDVTVLHGIEANIREDGLDVSTDWLEQCDLVVCALHDRPRDATQWILTAFKEYPVDIFAHPQNRLIHEREPVGFDLDAVMEAARDHDVAVEINAQPDRLDLDWSLVKEYRDTVQFVISTDAHTVSSLQYMHLGVSQARRGWCERSDILNTATLPELMERLNG